MYSVQEDNNNQQPQQLQQPLRLQSPPPLPPPSSSQQDLHRKKHSICSVASSAMASSQGLKRTRKKDTIEMILSRPPMIVKSSLSQLRYHILVDGLKVPKDSEDVSRSSFITVIIIINYFLIYFSIHFLFV